MRLIIIVSKLQLGNLVSKKKEIIKYSSRLSKVLPEKENVQLSVQNYRQPAVDGNDTGAERREFLIFEFSSAIKNERE